MSVNKYTTAEGLVTLANGSRMWVGTKAAYEAAKQADMMPNDVLVAITDDSQDNNYSTEEVLTGKFWIDGKPIYRKVLLCTADTPLSSAGGWTTVAGWTIADTNIDTYTYINYTGSWAHRIDYSIGTNKSLTFYCLASNISILAGSALIIEYTKTTD